MFDPRIQGQGNNCCAAAATLMGTLAISVDVTISDLSKQVRIAEKYYR